MLSQYTGMHVTQATLSRDLDEIGVVRLRGADGTLVYALPADPGGHGSLAGTSLSGPALSGPAPSGPGTVRPVTVRTRPAVRPDRHRPARTSDPHVRAGDRLPRANRTVR